MIRQSIGFVEFSDLRFNTRSQIIITLLPEDKMMNIFLNQDADGRGVLGAGDVEVGLDRESTKRLLTLVREAISVHPGKDSLWQPVGQAEFSWSDHSNSGVDEGTVLIESNGSQARIVIRTKSGAWAPYVATFSSAILSELSALLSRALLGSQKA